MKQVIEQAVSAALQRLKTHSDLVGLSNVDEATFRSFVIAGIMERCPTAKCQTEWHRFDLLVQGHAVNVLVEFKFYLLRQTREINGRLGSWKGGAGPKNKSEYEACVGKLHNRRDAAVHHRLLILVYQVGYPRPSKYSFAESYDDLAADTRIGAVTDIPHGMAEKLACKIVEVLPSTSRV
jgi:hypothetical protein